MEFYDIVGWKSRLMQKLNDGIFNIDEWEQFILAAQACNCDAIADDMRNRFQHYAKKAKQEDDEEKLNQFRKLYKELKHVQQS